VSSATASRIASITVTYNPDPGRLSEQIRALRGQVDRILVVDNGSQAPVGDMLAADPGGPSIELIGLAENRGVASAFNIGVRRARERGAQFVLLLDHDSIPTPGMVTALRAAYERCAQSPGAPPVAAVGPRVNDVRDHREYPFIRMGWTHNRHLRCGADGAQALACDFIISSGTLIPLESFSSVGEFDESLFIDSVDLEWCCRARSRGLALYGVCAARLDHWLGDQRRRVLGNLRLVVHSPQRVYYMTRNRLLLYRRSYVPLKWKLKDVLRVVGKFAATRLLIAPRGEYARMTARAIRDALAQRGGKLTGGDA
jgi:rhamnosyltransferase